MKKAVSVLVTTVEALKIPSGINEVCLNLIESKSPLQVGLIF